MRRRDLNGEPSQPVLGLGRGIPAPGGHEARKSGRERGSGRRDEEVSHKEIGSETAGIGLISDGISPEGAQRRD
jgi:hypothetical protein